MLTHLLLLLLGLVILVVGAEALVRGASGIARRFGLSALVVGLTVVAFGTSAPELAVSVRASLAGSGSLALGNMLGSNIFNVAAILGLTALVRPLMVQRQVVRIDMPILLGCSILFIVFLYTGRSVGRIEGAILFAGILAYVVLTMRLARKEVPVEMESVPNPGGPLVQQIVFVAIGLAMLVGGAHLLVKHASELARAFHVSEAVIGLTLVAAGTSLPELATSVVAAFRKETDIAVGNIVGSNIFNLLCIGGGASLAAPLDSSGISHVDVAFMLGTSILLLPLMRTGFTLQRWEGALLLGCYGGYIFYLWPK